MQATPQYTSILPVLSLLVAATLWGLFWIPLRWLEQQGLQGLTVTVLIYSGTVVYALPLLWRHYREVTRTPGLLVGVALCSGWCNTAFILALLEGEVVRVILLFYLSPLWSTLLARFVLRETISLQLYLVVFASILGALIMLWSPAVGLPWPESTADWLAISSGMTFAMTNMFINKARNASVQLKTVASWFGVVMVSALVLLGDTQSYMVPDNATLWYALLIGILLIGPMTGAVVYGVTHMPVHRSAVILLFEIVVSVVSTYLLIEERLSGREWIGGSIIVIAAYLAARLPAARTVPVT